jgi:WD40 repeat protein
MKLTLTHDHKLATGVLGLDFTSDGSRAFAACVDGRVYSVDVATGQAEALEGAHQSYASGCVLLPDNQTLISAGYDGMLLWHDLASGRCWRRLKAHSFWSWKMALSPDGSRVATTTGQYVPGGWKYEPAAESEPSVKVFDTRSGDLVAAFGHTPPVLSCAFTADGTHLAAANMMGEVRVWNLNDAASGQPVSQWTTPEFTSWGTTKTHHYCGGIYGLAFSPDASVLLCCGMGPMGDPMAGNGKMTWQRWNWARGERVDQIKDALQGAGLMESIAWHPAGTHFFMAGRQAQGTWNAGLFSATDGSLVTSLDTKKRITHARFTANGGTLLLSGAHGQGVRKQGAWPPWGSLQTYRVEA